MSNGIGKLSPEGRAWIVQTENPTSAHLYESDRTTFLPRSKSFGAILTQQWGGTWRYIPGSGCKGSWSVEGADVDHLATIIALSGIPLTVYRYPGRETPGILAELASATFDHNRSTGYYDLEAQQDA